MKQNNDSIFALMKILEDVKPDAFVCSLCCKPRKKVVRYWNVKNIDKYNVKNIDKYNVLKICKFCVKRMLGEFEK